MAAALGDIIRITDRQRYLVQQVLNVYFYRVTSLTGLTGDYLGVFATNFQGAVLDPVKELQVEALTHESLYLENLTNGIDISEVTDGFPQTGEYGNVDGMPPFVSYGFQLVRESRVTRNGYKRFGGVPEAAVDAGVYVGDPALITDVENGLGADLQAGLVTYAEPVILKHPFTVPLVAPEYASISAGLYKGIGSQNTRKFGRGA